MIDHDTVSPSGPWILKQPVPPALAVFFCACETEDLTQTKAAVGVPSHRRRRAAATAVRERDQAAARVCGVKRRAWLISTFTCSGLKGFDTRKAGSGRSPVSSFSG